MNKWITDNLWRHVVGVLVAFFALFPLYLVIISSINPTGSLQVSSFIPTEFSLKNYQQLFNDPTIPYLVWMKNTLLISGAVAILSVIIGASSAFAFSRLRFKGKKFGIQLLFFVQTHLRFQMEFCTILFALQILSIVQHHLINT